MKTMCRIMERNCQGFQAVETPLYMMNSTDSIAATVTKHKFTASMLVQW